MNLGIEGDAMELGIATSIGLGQASGLAGGALRQLPSPERLFAACCNPDVLLVLALGSLALALCRTRHRRHARLPCPWPPPFEVFEAAGRGKAVRSLQPFEPGDVIFEEAPLLRWAMEGRVEDMTPIRGFLKLPPQVQKELLSLYCPDVIGLDGWGSLVGPHGENLEAFLDAIGVDGHFQPHVLASVWRLLCVAEVNTTTGPDFSAIYQWFSCMNHSCLPNCTTVARKNGDLVWVALTPVAAGEELCDTFIVGDPTLPSLDPLLLPTALRRERLARWGFTCHCPRCCEPCEPETAFWCATCRRGVCNRVRGGDCCEDLEQGAQLTACSECGSAVADAADLLLQEASLVRAARSLAPILARKSPEAVLRLREQCRECRLADSHWLPRWLDVIAGTRRDGDHLDMAVLPARLLDFFAARSQALAMYT